LTTESLRPLTTVNIGLVGLGVRGEVFSIDVEDRVAGCISTTFGSYWLRKETPSLGGITNEPNARHGVLALGCPARALAGCRHTM